MWVLRLCLEVSDLVFREGVGAELTCVCTLIENIYLTGSVGALSNWNASTAILMSSANYPTWSSTFLSLSFSNTSLTERKHSFDVQQP
jgi:hypothetical protein